MRKEAFLFGYGIQGVSLAKGLRREDFDLHIIEATEEPFSRAKKDGFVNVRLLDVTEDAKLERLDIGDDSYIICVMDDKHLNVFLTLSLRSLFPKTTIVAISDSVHTTEKLKMAGANRIIDLYQVSAAHVHNILQKPIATKLLGSFVSDSYAISFKEMLISPNSYLNGMMTDDVNFSECGVLLLGIIEEESSEKFVFISSGIEHQLHSGDTIICIGYNDDLERFAKGMKESK
ncbi:TrkA family potassium uptake protein [Sulfurovum sp. bin170]|uniref:potassium channel family protein n=1 Tax=Sulfurovum sp. bin170 TaxID=2695268 RepID=UPI0013DFBE63|nr:NAD(P)-binding protein [Sulfurovum sp. bin170]NEW60111.1 TrkA family potassium uptake protein [Sulfurovum sp. bin170]